MLSLYENVINWSLHHWMCSEFFPKNIRKIEVFDRVYVSPLISLFAVNFNEIKTQITKMIQMVKIVTLIFQDFFTPFFDHCLILNCHNNTLKLLKLTFFALGYYLYDIYRTFCRRDMTYTVHVGYSGYLVVFWQNVHV